MVSGYVKGLLEISVEGMNLERFLNLCVENGIPLQNINRPRYGQMTCVIKADDLRTIAHLNRQLHCRIRIKRRYGLKFFINRLKRRKMFVLGAVLCVVFLIFMSSAIWRIDISGIDKVRATEILSIASEYGVEIGTLKKNFDTKELELEIRKQMPEIDWVTVKSSGVVLKIEVLEGVKGEQKLDETPADIIADYDCEILSVTPWRGLAMVKPGDIVTKGQVLVSGSIQDEDKDYLLLVAAHAKVTARVKYSGTATIYLKDLNKKLYTSNTNTNKCVKICNKTIFGSNAEPFAQYDTETTVYEIYQENRLFPITVEKQVQKEYRLLSEEELSNEAQKQASEKAVEEALRQVPISAQVEDTSVTVYYDAETGAFVAQAIVSAVQEVGTPQLIDLTQLETEEEN